MLILFVVLLYHIQKSRNLKTAMIFQIVKCRRKNVAWPHIGVLQPLTPAVASLTLIENDGLTALQKLKAFEERSGEETNSSSQTLEEFVESTVSHICGSSEYERGI